MNTLLDVVLLVLLVFVGAAVAQDVPLQKILLASNLQCLYLPQGSQTHQGTLLRILLPVAV
jgi:hypothetical protein